MSTEENRNRPEKQRKRLRLQILAFLALAVIMAAGKPLPARAENTADIVYRYVVDEMDLSPAAACGILANMKAESNLNAGIAGASGLGLCQWTGVRASRLRSFCASHNLNSSTAAGQVAFIHHELQNTFPQVYARLQAVTNDASGAYNAAYAFCVGFEIPANASYQGSRRGSIAKNEYWPVYGQNMIYLQAAPAGGGIELTWSGKAAGNMVVMRSTRKNGTFKKIDTVKRTQHSFLDTTVKKQVKYYYYVCTAKEYRNYVLKKKDPPGRSNKYEVTSARTLSDDDCIIELSAQEFEYNSKAVQPDIKITYAGKRLKEGRDYTVSFRNNKDAGRAVVRITGRGSYAGSVKRYFTIHKTKIRGKAKNLRVKLAAKQVTPVLTLIGMKDPKYRLLTSSNHAVAVIRNKKIVLKGAGTTKITLRIYGDKNHKTAKRTFSLKVKK